MKHVTDLTCCRALFAAWVFAYHVNLQTGYAAALGPLGRVFESGSVGVDGFFILSGMILAHAHPNLSLSAAEMRGFLAKRLVRIYPVHLAMIALLGAMIGCGALLGVHPREPERFGVDELLNHLALLHAWGVSDRWAWNYPSWSISAEWAGYLLFPLLWALLRRQNGIVVAIVLPLTLLGVLACRALAWRDGITLTYDGGALRLFPEFIAGICVIPILPALARRVRGRALCGVGVLVTLLGTQLAEPLRPLAAITVAGLWGVLAGLMVAAAQGRGALLSRAPGLIWLGEISYSYYMSFAIIETVQASLWRGLGAAPARAPLLYATTTTLLTLALATAAWFLVERPALRAFAAYTRRGRAGAVVAVRG